MVNCVSSVAQARQAVEKRVSAYLKGVENEVFSVKKMHLKFSFLSFAKFIIFAKKKKKKKKMFYHFN